MKRILLNIQLLALVGLLGACNGLLGEEIARLPVNVLSTEGHEVVKEASVQLKQGDNVALWSDMDIAYEGEQPLRFEVVVTRDGAPFKQLEINPTEKHVVVGQVRTNVNGKITWRFSGRNTELPIPATGTYVFRARLVAVAPNPTLKIAKAELVLKK